MNMYKIHNTRTNLYSMGGKFPSWSKKGKVWRSESDLRAHISLVVNSRANAEQFEDCEIVVLEVVERQRVAVEDFFIPKREEKVIQITANGLSDNVSGREVGANFARLTNVSGLISRGFVIRLTVDPRIKAINDSFFKGFFGEVFQQYKSAAAVAEHFVLPPDAYYKRLISKNWKILEALS